MQEFLLELGKGFAFVGKQYKIHIEGRFFRVDLLFYHRILKCFVLIGLKRNEVEHGDIGQMNFYLNYFREEENTAGDNEPIGIILAREKSELVVRYATTNINANLLSPNISCICQKEMSWSKNYEQLWKRMTSCNYLSNGA